MQHAEQLSSRAGTVSVQMGMVDRQRSGCMRRYGTLMCLGHSTMAGCQSAVRTQGVLQARPAGQLALHGLNTWPPTAMVTCCRLGSVRGTAQAGMTNWRRACALYRKCCRGVPPGGPPPAERGASAIRSRPPPGPDSARAIACTGNEQPSCRATAACRLHLNHSSQARGAQRLPVHTGETKPHPCEVCVLVLCLSQPAI